jgi:hypothetical protein
VGPPPPTHERFPFQEPLEVAGWTAAAKVKSGVKIAKETIPAGNRQARTVWKVIRVVVVS